MRVPTLQEYVLVSQDSRRVEVLRREADWLAEIVEEGAILQLRSIGLDLTFDTIYDDV